MNVPWPRKSRRTMMTLSALLVAMVALATGAIASGTVSVPFAATDASTTPTASNGASSGSTSASSGQPGNASAVVVNHNDNSYRYAITLKVVQIASDVVTPQNAAVAVASCTNCQTVAISLEGVLVYGDPSVFAPTNLALAYNENCTNCATLAAAYQMEQQYFQRCRITGAGRVEIARIRRDLEAIRLDHTLTLAQIDQRVQADAAALLDVLRNDVVPVGRAGAPNPTSTSTPTSAAAATASPSTTSSQSSSSTPASSTPASSTPATSTSTAPASTTSTTP